MNQKKTHTNKSASLCLFFSMLTVYLFFYNTDIKSQDNIPDLPNDSITVKKIFDLAWSLEIENPDSAIILYELGAEISNQINYPIGLGRGLQYKGIVLSDQGRYDEAIEELEEEVEIINGNGSTTKPILSIIDTNYGNNIDLGGVSADGSAIATAIKDQSLLRIRYQTQYFKFRIKNTDPEKVQFYFEEAA